MEIRNFNTDEQVLIIAEIGNNHEGSFDVAQQMVQAAADCGVDAVKFQTFKTEHYVSQSDTARFERLKSFELNEQEFTELSQMARELGLLFISTPFDLASAELLQDLVDGYKIASGDNTFFPLIRRVLQTKKPLIISTGISDGEEIAQLTQFVKQQVPDEEIAQRFALLHCVSSYPTPPEEANLRSIKYLAERFDCTVGYSDHTLGTEAAIVSVSLGARIIEKHFTLDKNYSDFRDHQISADPSEMKMLVRQVHLASQMLGSVDKVRQSCEQPVAEAIRRSIVAGCDAPKGYCVTPQDLTWIRPGGGLAPGQEHLLVGKKLKHDVHFGERLTPADVE